MSSNSKNNKEISNYKTIMCGRWLKYSSCSHGAKCAFAHGKDELRKTIICPSYATSKICNSTSCNLLHIDVSNIEQVFDELYHTIQARNRYYHDKEDILLDLDDIQKERDDLVIEKEKIQRERDFLLNEQSKLLQRIFELQQQNNLLSESEIENKLKCNILLEQLASMHIQKLFNTIPQSPSNRSHNQSHPNNAPVALSGQKRKNISDI
jgi:hypothetical protein